ncbi:hypothetical protein ACH5RR_018231 [Cinchona calisaya]|uniref:Phosphate transporter n=1 Tax=Cinchona calisaya TaxID=153742 RepID=A0ABD2ZPK4_9GENT
MLTNRKIIPVNVAVGVVGKWKETYQWIPIFSGIATFSLAFSAGANNLPTSFSLPLGSGWLTFLKAAIAAFVVYVPGTALASGGSFSILYFDFLKEGQPNEGFLMWSMVVVLITATLWLSIATYFELPVSSQQSTQGALLGTMLVSEGFGFIPLWNKNGYHNFNGGGILWIFLEWTIAAVVACAAAFLFFKILKVALLGHENAEKRILIFLPIYYGIAAGLLCFFIMCQVIPNFMVVNMWTIIIAVTLATLIGAVSSSFVAVPFVRTRINYVPHFKTIKKTKSMEQEGLENLDQTASDAKVEDDGKFEEMLRDFMQMRVLDTVYEEEERSWASPENTAASEHNPSNPELMIGSTPLRQLLESTPNQLVKPRNSQSIEKTTAGERVFYAITDSVKSILYPVIHYDRPTLIRHALAEKFDDMEDVFGFPLLLSSCIFALIQSANEVAPLMIPFRAILDVFKHNKVFRKWRRCGFFRGSVVD